MIHSCGREGFKNTREGTNIAAQATAITIATVQQFHFNSCYNGFKFGNLYCIERSCGRFPRRSCYCTRPWTGKNGESTIYIYFMSRTKILP